VTQPLDSLRTSELHSNASAHLSELCVEWLETVYFLSKATEIDQLWGPLTILRLGRFRLTLRGFVGREAMLQRLFSLPRLRSISNARVCLDDDGCWRRVLTAQRMRKCAEVHLSGWSANDMTGFAGMVMVTRTTCFEITQGG
jgi:hypothetical protein